MLDSHFVVRQYEFIMNKVMQEILTNPHVRNSSSAKAYTAKVMQAGKPWAGEQ